MSTAVASASTTPLPLDRDPSPKNYASLAPSNPGPVIERNAEPSSTQPAQTSSPPQQPERNQKTTPEGRRSSPKPLRSAGVPPKIIVKKEAPSSPSLAGNARHRPRKLDLSTNAPAGGGAMSARPSGTPHTSRDGGLAMHDVGLACLSPGFQTHDPAMREQLQRSISVRDQQRSIIESRLQKTAKGDGSEAPRPAETSPFTGLSQKTASSAKKRPPPAGLSIVPPSAAQFANERVVQSAPLHQTFTGRHEPQPPTRHVVNQPSNLSATSHIHHVPAVQTNNRLPPISDVFGAETLGTGTRNGFFPPGSASNSSHSNQRQPFPSPGLPPHTSQPQPSSSRPREYRSAEEAVQEMTGGREDLLPRIVHYGGHQPPTPPSPQTGNGVTPQKYNHSTQPSTDIRSANGRRRTRNEYEGDSSPPLGTGREPRQHGPFGFGRDSPETQRKKKEEFLGLCSRAWDLFHS